MELILIRHTKVNCKQGICYGFTDVDVAPSFESEAKNIAQQLQAISIDEIWCSPLKRCTKLANYLFADADINTDDRLKELNFGDWEMQSWDDISNSKSGIEWMDDFVNKQCPNGESFHNQFERIKEFFTEKKKDFANKQIAIVAHGGTIRALLCHLQNIDLTNAFNIQVDYGSLTKITID